MNEGLRCPKCGKPVFVRGQVDDNRGKLGQPRYSHRGEDRKLCRWHGCRPIGQEEADSKGVDRATSEALSKSIRGVKQARYVVTAAQNATPVNRRFLASLLAYCQHRHAQLIVIPYRYRNPTSIWSEKADHDDWWAPELASYILDIRTNLSQNLVLLADIKTQPTASSPLTGFETLTGSQSAIIGHPKIELVTVPTPQSRMAKILTTTGAVTERNYIASKAGKKGEHHHTFGACVVELDGRRFHLRQINAVRDGSFIDLDTEYSGEARRKVRAAALVMGDSHVEFIDPDVCKATFGKGGIVETLRPEHLVWHDVFDSYSVSHHHRGEVFTRLAKHRTGRDNVQQELARTFDFIDRVTPPNVRNIFVPSNHPDHLARWVKETDPRTDLENCVFWAETFKAMADATRMTKNGAQTVDPFVYWAKRKLKTAGRSIFLGRNDSYRIKDIEISLHGDVGANGARGSRVGISKIGVKSIIGHSHSPGIKDGCMQTGTSSYLRLEYTGGPSSWLQSHGAIYENGKRSLLIIIDGEWRA